MKFTQGYWSMRPGFTPHYAAQVHEVQVEPGALVVTAATRRLSGRGDTINTPLLTVRLSSPLENVIRVQITHHKGGNTAKPRFDLQEQPAPQARIDDGPQAATLASGRLAARVQKDGEWRMDFLDGERLVTASQARAMGFVDTPQGRYMLAQLSLGVGECVYGLGERFTPFVKNGQVIEMWNEDGGTSSELAYKNVPFYLTNRGYGVFVNHPERVSFEIASENVARLQFSVPGEQLEYFLIYGPSPKQALERYTALTGRPALPPAWSFGLWLTTSFTTDYDEATVSAFVQGMADRDLPLHVFHFDCFWMKAFHWCDLEWDERQFPDPQGMLARLKARGLRVCAWINPYIAQQSALFDEGMQAGYLLKRPDGPVWQTDQWQPGMGVVDFTNPAARRWYGEKLGALLDIGVDCFKTDFGERIPVEVVYHDGSDPLRMHNYYAFLYNQSVFELLEQRLGKGQAVVFARAATAGSQRFPVHWGGDSTATFESMAESLRGGLSLGLSGFGFWSHDIGGFVDTATPELYKRWCAFGLLSSHSRLHGNTSYRVPWLFDDEAVQVLRFFTRLKCRLMPYLFGAAVEAHQYGAPVMRAMILEFPDDPACEALDRQYMLGEQLLVAPVFSAQGQVSYYVPAGRWTNFLNGQVIEGPAWVQEQHGFLSLPLLARPNAVIPVGACDDRPDYDYAEGVTLQAYELTQGEQQVTIPDGSGGVAARFTLSRRGEDVTAERQGEARAWSLLLAGVKADEVVAVEGGSLEASALGALVHAAPDTGKMIVKYSRD
jgi:alpha-D-xyloside xylohydrolase